MQLIPKMASHLLQSLMKVDCKQLVELKLEHFDLSSKQNMALICKFLNIQEKLVNLTLKDCGFKLLELGMIL